MKKIKLLLASLFAVMALVACNTQQNTVVEDNKEVVEQDSTSENGQNENNNEFRNSASKFLTINGKEVSYSDYYKMYDLYAGIIALQQNLTNELTQMIVRDSIITKELEEKKVEVTDEEVEAELKKYVDNLGSEEEFNKYINLLGVNIDTFKQNIKNSLKASKHKELYLESNKPTDEEIIKYYEENSDKIDAIDAKHILVETEELAKEISQKLKDESATFDELNIEHSIDETAKQNGGNLGLMTKAQLVPEFVEGAFKLEENQVSDPIKTQFGYHVVVVNKKNVGLDANKEAITNAISSQKYEADISGKVQNAEVKFFELNGEEAK